MKEKSIWFEGACIFSIVGSSIGFLSTLGVTLFFKAATENITLLTNSTATNQLSPLYFSIFMASFCLSLVGAIKLYHMQKVGIYFYLLAQIIQVFLPVLWLGSNSFSTTNAIFAILFSVVYLSNYKKLKS